MLLEEKGEGINKMNIDIVRHVFPVEFFLLLIFLDPGTTDMQMSRDRIYFRRRTDRPHALSLIDEGGMKMIGAGLQVAAGHGWPSVTRSREG